MSDKAKANLHFFLTYLTPILVSIVGIIALRTYDKVEQTATIVAAHSAQIDDVKTDIRELRDCKNRVSYNQPGK